MKRILLTIMVLAAVLSLGGAGSFAYLTDSEISTGNTFTVGTWDLGSDSGTFDVTGVTGSQTLTVTNIGTVPAYLYLDINITGSTGDLVNHLTAYLYVVGGGDIYGPATMSTIIGSYATDLLLDSGDSGSIALDWAVDGAYAPSESESVTFTVNFYLQP